MKKNIFGYIAWLVITLFVVYAFSLNTAGAVFADAFKTTLHLSDIGAAFAVGSFILGFACMQIPAGYMLDQFAIRSIVSGGVLFLALGNITLIYSSHLALFALSNFIQGVGASFAFIATGKIISEWFTPRVFPILLGLTQTLACTLSALIHYFLVHALRAVSWQKLYVGFAFWGFTLFILVLFFVSSPEKTNKEHRISLSKSLSAVLKCKQIWLCSISAATSFGVVLAYGSYWYLKVQAHLGWDASNSLIISGMVFVGIGLGTPFFGWFSNKIHSRKRAIRISLAMGTLFLSLGLYLPHFDISTYLPIEFISFFIGFFLSGSMLYYTCVSEISTSKVRATALGLINTSVFLFNTALLFIPQFFITKKSLIYFSYLWILPVCVLIALLCGHFVKETVKKDP